MFIHISALREFERLYEEKTGNRWSKRKEFQKVPGKFYPLEMDFGQDTEEIKKLNLAESKSKLDKPIQELISMIFDIESMKKAMIEFEIDLTKMPLGKISKKQIEQGYSILTEVQNMIKNENGNHSKFLDCSNRFFTLIPHDFGMKTPPILDNPDFVKSKVIFFIFIYLYFSFIFYFLFYFFFYFLFFILFIFYFSFFIFYFLFFQFFIY